jgi:hypothetical protein
MQSEAALRQQIELINHKNLQELRDQFRELHGFEGGDTTPRNLRKRIIYRLQEIYYGGVEPIDMEILDSIAGYLYLKGKGVKKDKAEARKWLEKAAAQGDPYATDLLKELED